MLQFVPSEKGPRAISLVVAGGSLAAVLGPELSKQARTALDKVRWLAILLSSHFR